MKRIGNYRDMEDLSKEEVSRLDHLERMTKDYGEMSFSTKATKPQQWKFQKKWNRFRKELEDYKKEIGIA